MERDLLELFESAKKAADLANVKGILAGKAEASRCVDALNKLRDFPINPDFLVSSRIMRRLDCLTQSKDCRIKRSASALLQHWEQSIRDSLTNKTPKRRRFIIRLKLSKSGSSSSSDQKAKSECSSSSDAKEKSCPSSASVVKDKDKDNSRGKIRNMIVSALSRVSEEVDEKMKDQVKECNAERVGMEVESVMFEKMGPFHGKTKNKYRSIMFNLTDSKNPDFRRNVLLGRISPQRIVDMKTEEMASSEVQDKIRVCREKITKSEEEKIRYIDV